MINGTLKSLILDQTIKPDEIIVINGGGKNNCQEFLLKWKKIFIDLLIFNVKNINLSVSRNIGLPKCSGDIILLTDDDAIPNSNWVENIKKYHKEFPNAGLIGGEVINESGGDFLSKIADVSTFPRFNSIKKVRTLPGVNSSYKKQVISEVGKYDESLFRGEDVDYNWRVLKNGWDIIYVPSIKVRHIHRDTWFKLFYQHYMYGRAYYLLRRKWIKMYSIYPHKINSFKNMFKYIFSWTLIPFLDAYSKSKKFKGSNFFVISIIFLINIINRIGIFIQKNYYEQKK